ncbi:MAG: hypothetical protein GY716_10855 [bacterium]|nr:hypothetical protein [bacterium]
MSPNPSNGTQRSKYIVPLLLSVVGLSIAIGLAFYLNTPGADAAAETAEVPAKVKLSSEQLDFGVVPLHSDIVRQLVLRNDSDEPVNAMLSTDASHYSVTPSRIELAPGEFAAVSVTARTDEPADLEDSLNIRVGDDSVLTVALKGKAHARFASNDGAARPATEAASETRMTAMRTTTNERVNTTTSASTPTRAPKWKHRPVETRVKASSNGASSNRKINGKRPITRRAQSDTQNSEPAADPNQLDWDNIPRRVVGTPIPTFNDTPTSVPSDEITASDQDRAVPLPSQVDRDGTNTLPEDLDPNRDAPGDDLEDVDRDDPFDNDEPTLGPSLVISGVSKIVALGSATSFYPQQIAVEHFAGPLTLQQPIQFPVLPLALGESMLFAQTGGIAGAYDPATGTVTLEVPLAAVDSDGDAAPMAMTLTTGTVFERNEAGVVISVSGTPRSAGNGLLKLVGVKKIPRGFGNGGQDKLVTIEILATLQFGNSNTTASLPADASTTRGL